jgi:hypothetical protein
MTSAGGDDYDDDDDNDGGGYDGGWGDIPDMLAGGGMEMGDDQLEMVQVGLLCCPGLLLLPRPAAAAVLLFGAARSSFIARAACKMGSEGGEGAAHHSSPYLRICLLTCHLPPPAGHPPRGEGRG